MNQTSLHFQISKNAYVPTVVPLLVHKNNWDTFASHAATVENKAVCVLGKLTWGFTEICKQMNWLWNTKEFEILKSYKDYNPSPQEKFVFHSLKVWGLGDWDSCGKIGLNRVLPFLVHSWWFEIKSLTWPKINTRGEFFSHSKSGRVYEFI